MPSNEECPARPALPPSEYVLQIGAWSRGELLVTIHLDRMTAVPRWVIMIAEKLQAPNQATCDQVLQDFGLQGAAETGDQVHQGVLMGRCFALRAGVTPHAG